MYAHATMRDAGQQCHAPQCHNSLKIENKSTKTATIYCQHTTCHVVCKLVYHSTHQLNSANLA